jgi:hypothetical protein
MKSCSECSVGIEEVYYELIVLKCNDMEYGFPFAPIRIILCKSCYFMPVNIHKCVTSNDVIVEKST